MRRIDWSLPAEMDLALIDNHWWPISPQLADSMLDRIEAAAEFLLSAPQAGPAIEDGPARQWTVRKTPYVLVYRLLPASIEILRVHHQQEDWRTSE